VALVARVSSSALRVSDAHCPPDVEVWLARWYRERTPQRHQCTGWV